MRRFQRRDLSGRAASYLEKKTAGILALSGREARKRAVQAQWPAVRQTKVVGHDVLDTLRQMVGLRERCMYCEDSRGTDVEHFWPKSKYPEKAFDWPNLLLSCMGCQRAKGDTFPLDAAGRPELIDPTADDPWDFLYYVFETGVITPRYQRPSGAESPRGQCTVRLLDLNQEAITEGRKRAARHLRRSVQTFLDRAQGGLDGAIGRQAAAELSEAFREGVQYGLADWFLNRDGRDNAPFRDLRVRFPEAWREVLDELGTPGTGEGS